MNFKDILSRVRDILEKDSSLKIYDKDIARALDISPEYLSLCKNRNTITYEQISIFCARRRVSINWILYEQLPKMIDTNRENQIKVKYYEEISASAGGGAINYDSEHSYLNFDKSILSSIYKTNVVESENILAFNVLGDSMQPTLNDGEIIIFDTKKNEINRGGIFVVSTLGGLLVKRVNRKSNGDIELISDNKSYPSETINSYNLNDINFIGRVIGKVGEVY